MSRLKFNITFPGDGDELDEVTHSLPGKYAICSRCEGRGRHTNPNIDGNGITGDEWHNEWSHEEQEMYLTGGYDVGCERGCQDGKVIICDEEVLTPPEKELLEKWEKEQEEREYEDYCDRRMRAAEDGYYY
jgi:hypothetical protein